MGLSAISVPCFLCLRERQSQISTALKYTQPVHLRPFVSTTCPQLRLYQWPQIRPATSTPKFASHRANFILYRGLEPGKTEAQALVNQARRLK